MVLLRVLAWAAMAQGSFISCMWQASTDSAIRWHTSTQARPQAAVRYSNTVLICRLHTNHHVAVPPRAHGLLAAKQLPSRAAVP